MNEVGVVLAILIFFIFAILSFIAKMREEHLIETGQAEHIVKIAASGRGTTYHSPSCNRCRGGVILTLAEAQAKYYARCASCGGKPSLRRK